MVIGMKKVMILTKIPPVEKGNRNIPQEPLTELALALLRKGTCELIRVQSHQKLLHCLRTFALISPLFCPHCAFLCVPFFSDFLFLGFVCRSYANAREAVHAISSEASWYYELPCFCSCIKNY